MIDLTKRNRLIDHLMVQRQKSTLWYLSGLICEKRIGEIVLTN